MGTVGLADVRQAGAGGALMFFQLYVFKNRAFVRQLVQRKPLCRRQSYPKTAEPNNAAILTNFLGSFCFKSKTAPANFHCSARPCQQ